MGRSRERRQAWAATGRCFVCGLTREPEFHLSTMLCLHHFIRANLRQRGIFFVNPQYSSANSRVRKDRRTRRPLIANYLRARYIAVNHRRIEPFANIREALFFIDQMWDDLKLNHSFVLRKFRLTGLVEFLFHLDRIATGKGQRLKQWRGPMSNRHTGLARRNRDPRRVGKDPVLQIVRV